MQNKSSKTNAKKVVQKETTMQQATTKKSYPTQLKLAFLLGIISFAVYANTLKNGYTVDDGSVTIENKIVTKGISAIPEILSTPYRRGVNLTSNDLYRPLSLVMFAVEYQLFGPNPAPSHFFNILLFGCCVILLFLFLDAFFERKKTFVTFIASLLFALHPIHTEVVANIKSRDELLCFLFVFLSLNVFLKYIQTGKMSQLLIGAFCFFLSILSKETAFTFLAVIPLIFLFYRNENKKRSISIILCAGLVAIICLVIRFSVLSYYHSNDLTNIPFIDNALAKQSLSSESRIATAILILGYYIKLLFVPYPLIWDYSYNVIPFAHFSDMPVLISLVGYLFLVIFSIKQLVRKNKDPFAFGILFFLITIALFSNIPFLIGSAMGERFLFFPSVGFCLVIALAMEKWLVKPGGTSTSLFRNKAVSGIIIPVSIIYAVITINRNNEWTDNFTLYSSDVEKAPNGAKLNYFVGYELATTIAKQEKDPVKQKQVFEHAINYLSKALSIYPDYDKAEANLAYAYFCIARYDSSELHGKRAILLNPDNSFALSNLAAVYNYKKDYPKAIELYKSAVRVNPNDASSYAYIGLSFGTLGKYDSAIVYCNKAIAVDPTFNASYEILATTYKILGNSDSSKKYEAIVQKNKARSNL